MNAISRLTKIVRDCKFIETEKEGVSLHGPLTRNLADEADAELAALKANQRYPHDCMAWRDEGIGCSICSNVLKGLRGETLLKAAIGQSWAVITLQNEVKELKDKIDEALSVVNAPTHDNDGGPGDIVEEMKTLKHNLSAIAMDLHGEKERILNEIVGICLEEETTSELVNRPLGGILRVALIALGIEKPERNRKKVAITVPLEDLKTLEWSACGGRYGMPARCPICLGIAQGPSIWLSGPEPEKPGHRPDCWLGNTIARHKKE